MWIKTADLDASSGPAVFISFSVTTKINKKMDEILSKHGGVSYYKYSDYKLIRNCAFGSRTEALLDSDGFDVLKRVILMDKKYENIIGEILKDILPIEWMRFTMFHADDPYLYVPFLLFRVYEENEKFYEICDRVETFKGNVKWGIIRYPLKHHVNYILSIEEMKVFHAQDRDNFLSQEEFFGKEKFRELCDKAIDDIPLLAGYLREQFKEYLSNSLTSD